MDIVIIGSGNVAWVLGSLMKNTGHQILQVCGRNNAATTELAQILATNACNDLEQLNNQADIYLLAVSDSALQGVAEKINFPGKIIVHTAGAVSKQVLKNCSTEIGVFYPLQSLRKEKMAYSSIPILIEGINEHVEIKLHELASSISNVVSVCNENDRVKMHLAAVFANNFVNHIFTLTEDYCRNEQLDFSVLKPLIEETVLRINSNSPSEVQTGPAIRHDTATIEKHLDLLKNYPEYQEIYTLLTNAIMAKYIL